MIDQKNPRRDFLKKTGALIGIGVFSGPVVSMLCSCEKDELNPAIPDQSLKLNLNETAYAALQTIGSVIIIEVKGIDGAKIPLIVKRKGETEFGVYNRNCPHLGVPVLKGATDADDVYCPLHSVKFATDTGLVTANPQSISITTLKKYNYTYDPAGKILSVEIKA